MSNTQLQTLITPWLIVPARQHALDFYESAWGAIPVYRLEDPEGNIVARLSVEGAEFWISEDPSWQPSVDRPMRLVLTVNDPESVFSRAIDAGAKSIFPVSEQHGWKLGRITDPFGHHWEIGHPLQEL